MTRVGRIQRIGQVRPEVDVCNLRYANSVEDRVRQLLSERLEPDTLEDVWVQVALGRIEERFTAGSPPRPRGRG